jgi:hypothetical protein
VLATRAAPDEHAYLTLGEECLVIESERSSGRLASGWALVGDFGVHRQETREGAGVRWAC